MTTPRSPAAACCAGGLAAGGTGAGRLRRHPAAARPSAAWSSSAAASAAPRRRATCAVGRQRRRDAGRAQRAVRLLPDLQPGARRPQADGRHHARLRRPAALGVKVVQGEVVAIDAAASKVRLADGRELAYDRLVCRPASTSCSTRWAGCDAGRGQRPRAARLEGRPADAWRCAAARGHARRRRVCADHPQGALPLPARPVRARLHGGQLPEAAKPRAKLLVLDANPEIQSRRRCSSAPSSRALRGHARVPPNAELKEVAAPRVAKLEFEDVKADVLNVVPPQRAGDIARRPGWSTSTTAGWA
jgi:hypothetical protein